MLFQRLRQSQKCEETARSKARVRKESVQMMLAEAQTQEQVMETYHTLLEGEDKELASRISWTIDGKLIVQKARVEETLEDLKLLRWSQTREHYPTDSESEEEVSIRSS